MLPYQIGLRTRSISAAVAVAPSADSITNYAIVVALWTWRHFCTEEEYNRAAGSGFEE